MPAHLRLAALSIGERPSDAGPSLLTHRPFDCFDAHLEVLPLAVTEYDGCHEVLAGLFCFISVDVDQLANDIRVDDEQSLSRDVQNDRQLALADEVHAVFGTEHHAGHDRRKPPVVVNQHAVEFAHAVMPCTDSSSLTNPPSQGVQTRSVRDPWKFQRPGVSEWRTATGRDICSFSDRRCFIRRTALVGVGHETARPVAGPLKTDWVDQTLSVKLFRRFLGAIALGVGAIFGHKAQSETHWSEPPNWISDSESEDRDSGDP